MTFYRCKRFDNFLNVFTLFVFVFIDVQLSYSTFPRSSRRFVNFNSLAVPLSTPEECARKCTNDGEPKNCYYSLHIEFYTTIGPACNTTGGESQCIIGDGYEKTLIPINRQLPGPPIEVCLNDRLIADVGNGASGLEITLHWHGIFQNGYQYYDGVPYVTQCPIASSSTFRYDFVVKNSGTHFYHSHMFTHILDGQYGPLIVRDSPANDPHYDLYDDDTIVILLSDWMHELSFERYPGWYRNDVGQIAKNFLINGLGTFTDPLTNKTTPWGRRATFNVQKGKRYRIRMINSFSTICISDFRIASHRLTIIAQDGANVKPRTVDSIITVAAERVDFILNANQSVDSYWIELRGLGACAETKPEVFQLGILRYENGPPLPSAPLPSYNDTSNGVIFNSLNTTQCDTSDTTTAICVNQMEAVENDPELLKVEPDERYILPFRFFNYTRYGDKTLFDRNTYPPFINDGGGQLISMFNNVTFFTPASPLLSQTSSYRTLCRQSELNACTQPCSCTEVIYSKLNNIVELVIYDDDPIRNLHHPFHLHGYEFKLFSLGPFVGDASPNIEVQEVIEQHIQRLERGEYHNPPGKDTVKVPMGGWVILRFKANNPGYWVLHCHFTWHHVTGMELTIRVGDDEDLPPPPPHFPKCDNWRLPVEIFNEFHNSKNAL